jgi:hypothetical protein
LNRLVSATETVTASTSITIGFGYDAADTRDDTGPTFASRNVRRNDSSSKP